jgi:hypothetical protein
VADRYFATTCAVDKLVHQAVAGDDEDCLIFGEGDMLDVLYEEVPALCLYDLQLKVGVLKKLLDSVQVLF